MKPLLRDNAPEGDGPSIFNSAGFLTGRYALNTRLRLLAEVPFSYWKYVDKSGGQIQDGHLTVGNIYLGGEWHVNPGSDRQVFIEAGLRLPTMPEPDFPDQRGHFTGLLAAQDRQDAFIDDYLPLQAFANVIYRPNEAMHFRLRGGPSYWLYMGADNPFVEIDNELFLRYAAEAWFTSPAITGAFGVTGQYVASAESGSVFDRSVHQLTAQLMKDFDGYTLSGYIRAPIDRNNGTLVIVTYGLSLMF